MVEYYKKSADGLCCLLVSPPPKEAPMTNGLGKDEWEISRDSINLSKRLGAGQFGEVWMGIWKGTTQVAIKTLKPGTMTQQAFLEEAQIMKRLRHKNLVQLLAVCTDGLPVYIITEFMLNGSLLDYLSKGAGKNTEVDVLIEFCSNVACGMAHLEKEHFIHRDLAARNILVNDKLVCKVADFGMARLTNENPYMAAEGTKFPVKWTAPEAVHYCVFTTKSDVWSYGVLLIEIFTRGKIPYPGMTNAESLQQIERGYRMPCPSECPQQIYDLIRKCWNDNPESRPTFEYISEYFADYGCTNDSAYKDTT